MILLWIMISLFTIVALGFILIPLLYIPKKQIVINEKLQVAIYREQLENLTIQFQNAEISSKDYKQSCSELKKALLISIPEKPATGIEFFSSYQTAIILLLIFPFLALLLYLHWGNSKTFSQWSYAQQQKTQLQATITKFGSIENIIAALHARLQQQPNSAEGWYLLGKIYLSQHQFKNAVAAFNKANTLKQNDPEIMQNYAESLFFVNQAKLTEQLKNLLNKVLLLQPNNLTALNLFALSSYRTGNYQDAIHYWEKLLPLIPTESADEKMVLAMIAKAQQQLVPHKLIKIPIKVVLAPDLQAKVAADDTVFIYAGALSGPPMPLAVIRKQVKNLPLTTTITPADAMLSDVTLADVKQVKIFARVSKSGQALPQAGDLQGESKVIAIQQKQMVVIVINKTLNKV